jgi:hypothetical protein
MIMLYRNINNLDLFNWKRSSLFYMVVSQIVFAIFFFKIVLFLKIIILTNKLGNDINFMYISIKAIQRHSIIRLKNFCFCKKNVCGRWSDTPVTLSWWKRYFCIKINFKHIFIQWIINNTSVCHFSGFRVINLLLDTKFAVLGHLGGQFSLSDFWNV